MDLHSQITYKKGGVTGIAIAVIVVALAVGLGYIFINSKSAPSPVTDTQTATSTDVTSTNPDSNTTVTLPGGTTATVGTSTYKDGTYTATGSYNSPGGLETVDVTLTLSGDVVTSANVVSGARDPESRRYQSAFISGYKQYVVGKKISSINLGTVSGSSLTPKGFNDAVTKIETQAKA